MNTIYFAHATGFPSPTYAPFFSALGQHGLVVDYIEKIAHDPDYPVTNNWPHLVDELEAHITRSHQQPVIGIGHSAGALLHYLLAQRNPALYSHLILLDPPVVLGWPTLIWWLAKRLGLSDRLTPAGSSKNRRTHFDNYEHAYKHLRPKTLFKNFTEASFEAYLTHGLVADPEGGLTLAFEKDKELALFRTAADHLWRTSQPLKMPGLYLTSEGSELGEMPFPKQLADKTGMEYKMLKGGHLFPQEHPQDTANCIAEWLRQSR